MAKFLLVCSRNRKANASLVQQVKQICGRLIPDNIVPRPLQLSSHDGIIQAVINPDPTLPTHNGSVCLGYMSAREANWWQVGAASPHGSFALFRSDARAIELIADVVASRTIWYCHTDELFIASTSQRAIVSLLGTFHFNVDVVPWLVSSGTLGPGGGWDSRVQRLPGDARLVLERHTWTLSLHTQPAIFQSSELSEKDYSRQFYDLLMGYMDSFRAVSWSQWRLLLSGGVDSRLLLLLLLQQRSMPRCISWGLAAALHEPGNDAYVARILAQRFHLKHDYFQTDGASESVDKVIERFLVAGEGRVDHIAGYLDGFAIWRMLFESGIAGVIRGDQAFGAKAVGMAADVPYLAGATTLSDFFSQKQRDTFELSPQLPPAWMQQQPGETLAGWRDRLRHAFRIPLILAALNDLKSAYVEIANPLLSRKVIELIREMPDALRTNKHLLRQVVQAMSPPVEFARFSATAETKAIFTQAAFVGWMREELASVHAQAVLPEGLRRYALTHLTVADAKPGKASGGITFSKWLPKRLKSHLKQAGVRPSLHPNILAFRACMVSQMTRMLAADAVAVRAATDEIFRGYVVSSNEPGCISSGASIGTQSS